MGKKKSTPAGSEIDVKDFTDFFTEKVKEITMQIKELKRLKKIYEVITQGIKGSIEATKRGALWDYYKDFDMINPDFLTFSDDMVSAAKMLLLRRVLDRSGLKTVKIYGVDGFGPDEVMLKEAIKFKEKGYEIGSHGKMLIGYDEKSKGIKKKMDSLKNFTDDELKEQSKAQAHRSGR